MPPRTRARAARRLRRPILMLARVVGNLCRVKVEGRRVDILTSANGRMQQQSEGAGHAFRGAMVAGDRWVISVHPAGGSGEDADSMSVARRVQAKVGGHLI